MPTLSPSDAIQIAKRGRKLLRSGRITHRQYVVLDCLLWSCRNPITGAIVVSYSALTKLCHVSRETIAGALTALGRLGVLTKIKRRVRVLWHQGGTASRQMTNAYALHPGTDTEFGGRPVIQLSIEKQAAFEGVRAAARAPDLLAMRRAVMAARAPRQSQAHFLGMAPGAQRPPVAENGSGAPDGATPGEDMQAPC